MATSWRRPAIDLINCSPGAVFARRAPERGRHGADYVSGAQGASRMRRPICNLSEKRAISRAAGRRVAELAGSSAAISSLRSSPEVGGGELM